MQLGMVGLGRMGAGMARRLAAAGHDVVGLDIDPSAVAALGQYGVAAGGDLPGLVAQLERPRAVWVMVPLRAVQPTIDALAPLLDDGDVLIDGGNSRYLDSQARAAALAPLGITFLDAGTSGGIWGLEQGYCLMVGGDADAARRLEPIFTSLAPPDGYRHVGASGAGHFTKMVHNGIEYALMQAYAEGFALLAESGLGVDVGDVAELWRHGSVVRSWLLDLAAAALDSDPALDELSGWVEDSGEGRWTVDAAVERAVPVPTIAASLFARFSSRRPDAFENRVLAALRQQFGGHAVRPPAPAPLPEPALPSEADPAPQPAAEAGDTPAAPGEAGDTPAAPGEAGDTPAAPGEQA